LAGFDDNAVAVLNSGGRYDPAADEWTATDATSPPAARYLHTAVWTGNEMIVWGGVGDGITFNTGGRYDPATDSWTATATTTAVLHKKDARGAVLVSWTRVQMRRRCC
jgi:N-acetylneuraminic acid mutarotase